MLWFLPQLPGRKKIHCSCTPRFILKRFAKRQLLHFWMIFLHEFTTVTGTIAISWEWPWRCASLKKDKKRNQILGQRILKLKKDLCRSGPAPFWRRHVLPSASINPNPKCQSRGKTFALLWVIPTLTHYSYIVSDNLEVFMAYIFWHSIWHSFWHIRWHPIWHSIWHLFWRSFWHSIWHLFWHSICHSLWHGHCGWGPAVPTDIWR